MSASGPGPLGPGLDVSSALEAARRRLYGPGGADERAVAEYERLAADERPATSAPPEPEPVVREAGPVRAGRPRGRRLLLVAAAVVAVGLTAAAVVWTRPALPQQVEVPALAGTTLFAYGRAHDPAAGPGAISYQPEGYTVFQPRGRTVAVALRCVGQGTVRISAGPRFDFRCTDAQRTQVLRDTGPRSAPFIVMGTTRGDVVWAARIVLLDPPRTAGAIPDFRSSCERCAVIGAEG